MRYSLAIGDLLPGATFPLAYAAAYTDRGVRDVAIGIKGGDSMFIAFAAEEMSRCIPSGSILIPVPSSRAGEYSGVDLLAQKIADLTHGFMVKAVARAVTVPSSHERRHKGFHGLSVERHAASMVVTPEGVNNVILGEGLPVLFIDNVVVSGATILAAMMTLGISPSHPMVGAFVFAAAPGVEGEKCIVS